MPVSYSILIAALITGLFGSGHCALMCGGIATSFPMRAPRVTWRMALEPNLGRVLGYALAGAVAGGLGHAIVDLAAVPGLRLAMRAAAGLVLVVAGLRMLALWPRAIAAPRLWQLLRPLQRRLLPASTPARRIALGALWGWMPCGLSATLLAAAWLQASAIGGAALMVAFGLGTLPVLLPLTWSGQRVWQGLLRGGARKAAAGVLIGIGALVMLAPWLVLMMPTLHGPLAALGCAVPAA